MQKLCMLLLRLSFQEQFVHWFCIQNPHCWHQKFYESENSVFLKEAKLHPLNEGRIHTVTEHNKQIKIIELFPFGK